MNRSTGRCMRQLRWLPAVWCVRALGRPARGAESRGSNASANASGGCTESPSALASGEGCTHTHTAEQAGFSAVRWIRATRSALSRIACGTTAAGRKRDGAGPFRRAEGELSLAGTRLEDNLANAEPARSRGVARAALSDHQGGALREALRTIRTSRATIRDGLPSTATVSPSVQHGSTPAA